MTFFSGAPKGRTSLPERAAAYHEIMGQPITIQNLSDAAIRRLQELAAHCGEDVGTLAGRMLDLHDRRAEIRHAI